MGLARLMSDPGRGNYASAYNTNLHHVDGKYLWRDTRATYAFYSVSTLARFGNITQYIYIMHNINYIKLQADRDNSYLNFRSICHQWKN